jgi:phosphonate transport system substrate-binding protein
MSDWSGPLRFGVSRLHGGVHVSESSRAFAAVIAKQLGVTAAVVEADDYAQLLDELLEGRVELGWLPPFTLARASQRGAEVAALCERKGRLLYRSGFVVHVGSPVKTVEDLRGARAAWTNASSAAGYLVPRAHLRQRGVDPEDLATEDFYGSTSAACGAVYAGDADVATCYLSEQAAHDPAEARKELTTALGDMIGQRLRILDVTAPIPPDGLAFARSLAAPARARLRTVLLELHQTAEGAQAMMALLQSERLAAATDEASRMLAHLTAFVSGHDDDVTVV